MLGSDLKLYLIGKPERLLPTGKVSGA
jgi:hypothetical protein